MTSNADDIMQTYLASSAEFGRILDSFTASRAEKNAARAGLADLTTGLAMHSVQRVEGRTALLTGLIVALEGVIDAVRVNPIGDALERLSQLREAAAGLLGIERGGANPPATTPTEVAAGIHEIVGTEAASTPNLRRLIASVEEILVERMGATVDMTEKTALETQIAKLTNLRLLASDPDDLTETTVLSGLSDILDLAVANLRIRPFDDTPGRLQTLIDRIARAQGDNTRERLGGSAETPSGDEDRDIVTDSDEDTAGDPATIASGDAGGHSASSSRKFSQLKDEYVEFFGQCKIRPERKKSVERLVAPLLDGRTQYESVGDELAIPWWFIGIIHGLEASFNFRTHLHNGDPLSARTVRVPAGHPRTGNPPFAWRQSAIDALRLKKFDQQDDWSLPRALFLWETYNGMGYRSRGVPSPYLWSFSSIYEKGKFVRDHVFDPDAVSRQCGAATLLKYLVEHDIVEIKRRTRVINADAAPTSLTPAITTALLASPLTSAKKELAFPGVLKNGSTDSGSKHGVRNAQEWCCFHKTNTDIDGEFGAGTTGAVIRFQQQSALPRTGIVDERTWLALSAPMRRALKPSPTNGPESLYDLTLRVARQHLKEHPEEVGNDNCGPWVRLYMNGKQGKHQPWCAGFVCFLVGQAALALDEKLPFKRQVGVDQLVADAKDSGRFISEDTLSTGNQRINRLRPGCLFVVRRTATDWTHTGIVTEVGTDSFKTIEGNTNDEGSRNGFEVCERSRSYKKKDFILLV